MEKIFAVLKSVLALLGTVTVPAMEKFVARDNFQIGQVGIDWVGRNFKNWFCGKIEEPAPETTLYCHKLSESTDDTYILRELDNDAETTLAHIFHLLSEQAKGQEGALTTGGYWNVFYVRDVEGQLRSVRVRWNIRCWCVNAFAVENVREGWLEGGRVFSRNS